MCPRCGSNHRTPLTGSNDPHWYRCKECGKEYHRVLTLAERIAIPNRA